jgi:small subunit ribosomal protein S17e
MKRIQRGPVRGISLKLQEEERERRLDFIPDVSSVDIENIPIDPDTKAMLRSLDLHNLPGLSAEVAPVSGGDRAERKPYVPRR